MALGIPRVDELLARLTAADLLEWEAFFALEPWGSRVDWQRTGMICATVANSVGNRTKVSDFMPEDLGVAYLRRRQTQDEQRQALINALGGRIRKKEEEPRG